jgi:hypothetical protein
MAVAGRFCLFAGRRASLALGASLALALGGAAAGCSASPPVAGGTTFVAFASDFNGFHSWPSAVATPSPDLPPVDAGGVSADGGATDGGVHPVPETEYWKIPSAITGNEFPLRTIIVKETNEVDPTARQVFALVKRGGDFNPTGAVNWEWYELKNNADGSVVISWQGYGPPSGSADIYGGNPAVCNTCHVKAAANDYVWSAALQLSNL